MRDLDVSFFSLLKHSSCFVPRKGVVPDYTIVSAEEERIFDNREGKEVIRVVEESVRGKKG